MSYLQTARTCQASKYLLCPFKRSLSIGWFSSQTRQVNARSRGIHMESNTSFEELLRRVESGAYLLGLLVAKVLFTCFGSWTLDTMCYTSEKKEDGISNRPHTVILFFCLDLFHRQCLNWHSEVQMNCLCGIPKAKVEDGEVETATSTEQYVYRIIMANLYPFKATFSDVFW